MIDFFTPEYPTRYPNTTYRWFNSDVPENYKECNSIYTPDSFNYVFNEQGFRCDSFNTPTAKRILFLGCSQTEGIGVPLEHCWAHTLLESIKIELNTPHIAYWNLGLAGCGFDSIARSLYLHMDQLKPQLVFILFPSPYRREIMSADRFDRWLPVGGKTQLDPLKNQIIMDPFWVRYQTEKNLALMDLLFTKYGTTVLWDSWYQEDDKNLEDVVSIRDLPSFRNKIVPSWPDYKFPKNDLARDGMHRGYHANRMYAQGIMNNHSKLILDTLNQEW